MSKSPEEIKKELRNAKHVQCMDISDGENECARTNYGVLVGYVLRDAIYIYITQLESDNETKQKRIDELESRLVQVERDRDAAVADIPHYCHLCRHNDRKSKHNAKRSPCSRCRTYDSDGCFEWRGVCAENTEEG